MCNPIAIGIAGIGMTAGSQIMNYMSQKGEAELQNEANQKFLDANKKAAILAAQQNEAQDTLRQSQDILAADAQLSDIDKLGKSTRSTAVVSAAEAGLTGNSVDAIINDIAVKNGVNKVRTGQNLKMKLDQVQADKQGILVDAQNNINTARQTVVRGPSIITPIFATAGAGLNTYNNYLQRQATAGNGPTYIPKPGSPAYQSPDVPFDESNLDSNQG